MMTLNLLGKQFAVIGIQWTENSVAVFYINTPGSYAPAMVVLSFGEFSDKVTKN